MHTVHRDVIDVANGIHMAVLRDKRMAKIVAFGVALPGLQFHDRFLGAEPIQHLKTRDYHPLAMPIAYRARATSRPFHQPAMGSRP
jgi:hypothetical protein